MTKTINTDEQIVFSITNTEPFSFYNISLQSNSYMNMPNIAQLDSGATAIVTGTINSNVNINTQLRIKGLYNSTIGSTPQIHTINITTDHKVNPCTKSIIKGDTVTWTNLINDNIQIILNGAVETTMSANSNYGKTFDAPNTHSYYFQVLL